MDLTIWLTDASFPFYWISNQVYLSTARRHSVCFTFKETPVYLFFVLRSIFRSFSIIVGRFISEIECRTRVHEGKCSLMQVQYTHGLMFYIRLSGEPKFSRVFLSRRNAFCHKENSRWCTVHRPGRLMRLSTWAILIERK